MVDMRAKRRFHVPQLRPGSTALPPGEARHASGALRLRAGAAVELFDGVGGSATGKITEIGRDRAIVSVECVDRSAMREGVIVHLGFSEPKGRRLDWLVEKASELGAASLRSVCFERSIRGSAVLTGSRRAHWLGHCVAAAKQSGLNFLPSIEDPTGLGGLAEEAAGSLVVLGQGSHEGRGGLSVREALSQRRGGQEIYVVVGPEGGLTESELSAATDAGFLPVRLGGSTLRIETAAIALLAAVIALAD